MPADVDLTPQIVNVRVRRGDAWSFQVTFPFDLTGYTIEAQLRAKPDDEDAVQLDITATNLAEGVIHIGQDGATTSGVWDLQLTAPAGLARTYLAGRLGVDKDVTHA